MQTLRAAIWRLLAAACLAITVGCAAGTSVSRPGPFPNAPQPEWAAASARATAASAIASALAQRGIPYRFGGDTPESGFDCSGLVRYAFAHASVDLPRTVAEQYRVGRTVDRHHLEPGDLVFFTVARPGPSHVGIVLDDETFVHAPGSGRTVRVERFTTPYWQSRLDGARRVTGLVSATAARPAAEARPAHQAGD
jgi:cell wall-associated NlpC family hydrolase